MTPADETHGDLRYPDMREEVLDALTALSDSDRHAAWGHWEPGATFYDDRKNVMESLEDCAVPPAKYVGVTLYPEEVEYIEVVWRLLLGLHGKLGKAPDSA